MGDRKILYSAHFLILSLPFSETVSCFLMIYNGPPSFRSISTLRSRETWHAFREVLLQPLVCTKPPGRLVHFQHKRIPFIFSIVQLWSHALLQIHLPSCQTNFNRPHVLSPSKGSSLYVQSNHLSCRSSFRVLEIKWRGCKCEYTATLKICYSHIRIIQLQIDLFVFGN